VIDYVILTAVKNEAAYYLENYPCVEKKSLKGLPCTVIDIEGKRVALVVSGIGTSFASSAATAALFALNPRAIFFSGTAGSFTKDKKIGDMIIVDRAYEVEIQGLKDALLGTEFEVGVAHTALDQVVSSVFSADDQLLDLAKAYAKGSGASVGMAASSNTFPSPPSLFSGVKNSGAVVIDMETSALYQVGWLYQVPVIAFRCVSNKLTEEGDYVEHKEEPLIGSERTAAEFMAHFVATDPVAERRTQPLTQQTTAG
jgi:adenosylhomocysteine nucleosidase